MSEPIIYINERNCYVAVIPNFLPPEESQQLHQELTSLPLIKHELRPMYGKRVFQPRLSICLNKPYAYSGRVHPAVPWSDKALFYCEKINQEFKTDFNAGMVNYYPTGQDYISAHSDDERTLADNQGVYGISTGSERDMVMRWKDTKDKVIIPLPPGSLFVMERDTQKLLTHEMPKRSKAGSRASITYRKFT